MLARSNDPDLAMARSSKPDPKLIEALVCPLTRSPLVYDEKRKELVSKAARLAYPIRDGIPVMVASEARELPED